MRILQCAPCIKGFPSVRKLQETFKNKEIIFLFISQDSNENKWKEFLTLHPELKGIHIRIGDSSFNEAYKINGIPRYIIIDKEGKIVNAFASHPEGNIKNTIAGLLK